MPAKKKDPTVRRRANKASTASVLTDVTREIDSSDYQAMTVAQLRALAKDRELKVTGRRKADLIEALVADDDPTPKLPERVTPEGDPLPWRPETLDWWADLWAAPMSNEYHSSDRHALYLLAVLMDAFWTSPTQQLAAEIRLQRQAFGLTPYDRRRLEWTIETVDAAKDAGDRRREGRGQSDPAKAPAPPAQDPRLHLVQ